MKEVIDKRFRATHKTAMAKFETKLHAETSHLGALIQNSFEAEFLETKKAFEIEFKEANFKSFEELTKEFTKNLYEAQ
jgi:hypothetical protein